MVLLAFTGIVLVVTLENHRSSLPGENFDHILHFFEQSNDSPIILTTSQLHIIARFESDDGHFQEMISVKIGNIEQKPYPKQKDESWRRHPKPS